MLELSAGMVNPTSTPRALAAPRGTTWMDIGGCGFREGKMLGLEGCRFGRCWVGRGVGLEDATLGGMPVWKMLGWEGCRFGRCWVGDGGMQV